MVFHFCLKHTDSVKFKLKKPKHPIEKMIMFIKENNEYYEQIKIKLHNNCYFKLVKLIKKKLNFRNIFRLSFIISLNYNIFQYIF